MLENGGAEAGGWCERMEELRQEAGVRNGRAEGGG